MSSVQCEGGREGERKMVVKWKYVVIDKFNVIHTKKITDTDQLMIHWRISSLGSLEIQTEIILLIAADRWVIWWYHRCSDESAMNARSSIYDGNWWTIQGELCS